MKKILAAVDGSDASLHAANLALEMADATGGAVTLVYVAHPTVLPALAGTVPAQVAPELRDSDLAHARAVVARAARALGRPELNGVGLLGPVAESITRLADDEGFDLVAVGSKARSTLGGAMTGSLTRRLMHMCRQPVLIAR